MYRVLSVEGNFIRISILAITNRHLSVYVWSMDFISRALQSLHIFVLKKKKKNILNPRKRGAGSSSVAASWFFVKNLIHKLLQRYVGLGYGDSVNHL